MITITAIITVTPGSDALMAAELLKVAAHVRANEPDTIDFFISQSRDNPCRFTTYERFTDAAAMDRHNGSEAVAVFFAAVKPHLAEPVILETCTELSAT
ncbi:antibiotic biosynthesis monooxygenase (plasmid) [Tistrella bauzanensis]|jgi:quinol monooxygenase YgiN|uniref:Antibiotic biosynthesis monooxygenase n=1 Tax=Tistrella arctica TaxID=3133430 RepID=A0ABU9YNX5_9PROT